MTDTKSQFPPITSVAIAICTWNRATLLAESLKRFLSLEIPRKVQLTVVIVDNNSTDGTHDVIETFSQNDSSVVGTVVHLVEKEQGHTFARNRAIHACDADLILWTDDDVLVPSDWVMKYINAANEQTETAFWGAAIDPFFPSGKPGWIEENWSKLAGCFAGRDLGEQVMQLTEDRLPYGANFAVRGGVLRQYKFSTDLGRRKDLVLGDDELELMRRLLAAGHSGCWVPNNPVRHVIPADRAHAKYVFDYFVGQGQAIAGTGAAWHDNPAALIRESKSEYRKYWIKRMFAGSDVWCSHLIRSALAKGQGVELELPSRNNDIPS